MIKEAIEKSGLSHKLVSQECAKLGESVAPSYISKLVNGEMEAPSEKKIKVLSKILNLKEDELLLEAYLDKAPIQISQFLNYSRTAILAVTFKVIENNFSKEDFEIIKKEFDKYSLSKFLVEVQPHLAEPNVSKVDDKLKLNYSKNKRIHISAEATITDPIGFKMPDDSMFPAIPKDAQFTIEIKKEYENGEILLPSIQGQERTAPRKCFFVDDKVMLCPINEKYKSEVLPKNDVIILGKIRKVISVLD